MAERTSALAGFAGSGPAMRPQIIAQGVVGSLVLPPTRPAPNQPVSPLPPTDLSRLPRDASMLYGIGRVDGSGRVASNDIVHALNWSSGSKLDVILTPQSIVLRSASDGLFSVPRRPCIVIPPAALTASTLEITC